MKYKYIILISLIIIYKSTLSQDALRYPFYQGWELGTNLGVNYFFGDVNDNKGRILNSTPLISSYFDEKRLMLDLHVSKYFSPYWGIRGHLSYGKIAGSSDDLNMYFNGEVFTMDMDICIQYLDFIFNRKENSKFKYYLFGGLGLSNFNNVRRKMGTNLYLGGYGYTNNGTVKGKITTEGMVKMGLGVGYMMNKFWMINFESTLYYIKTDKLDGYISNDTGLEGYGLISFGICYKFNFVKIISDDLYEKSSGTNDKPYNSGQNNKKKRKLNSQ